MMTSNREKIRSFIRMQKHTFAAAGVSHNQENVETSCNVYLLNFSYGHKRSFLSDDSTTAIFQCEMNNIAVVTQLHLGGTG